MVAKLTAPAPEPAAPPGDEPPVLLKVRQAARLMGTSYWTVYRLIEEGKLPAMRLRSQLRVRRSDLMDYIASGQLDG